MRHLLRHPNDPPIIASLDQFARAIDHPRGQLDHVLADPSRHYTEFPIPKKNGKPRTIHAPSGLLKGAQRKLLRWLGRQYRVPGHLHGGVPKRSVVTNAKPHVGKTMVGTLDVKDFYPNTRVEDILPIFHTAGLRGKALEAAVNLAVLEGHLIQGSPVSCFLANFGFIQVDESLIKICRRWKLWLTRFVDDIAISGMCDFRDLREPFIERIESRGFPVAPKKVDFVARHRRQVVTGLVVNRKMRPTNEFIREVKTRIWECREAGPAAVAAEQNVSVRRLRTSLSSKVSHIGHSDPRLGRKLRGLLRSVDWKPSHRARRSVVQR